MDLIARALGIGRTTAYQLAATGTFPIRIIRVGTAYHVPTAELLKALGVAPLPIGTTEKESGTQTGENST